MTEKTTENILKSAILLEKRGRAFYKKVANQTEHPATQEFFLMMADEEFTVREQVFLKNTMDQLGLHDEERELAEISIWDLVGSFARLVEELGLERRFDALSGQRPLREYVRDVLGKLAAGCEIDEDHTKRLLEELSVDALKSRPQGSSVPK